MTEIPSHLETVFREMYEESIKRVQCCICLDAIEPETLHIQSPEFGLYERRDEEAKAAADALNAETDKLRPDPDRVALLR